MNKTTPTVIYIVGRGHSGSTLLELLLNRNTSIAAMGEIQFFNLQIYRKHTTKWVGKCSCGSEPHSCQLWSNIITKIESNHSVDLLEKPFSWRVSDVGLEEEYGLRRPISWAINKFHRLIRTISYSYSCLPFSIFEHMYKNWITQRDEIATHYAAERGVHFVVDASKDPLQMRDIIKYSKLNTKIIYLTRDIRGLVWSAKKHKRHSTKLESIRWKRLNTKILNLLEVVPDDQWIHIKYEDICNSTHDTIKSIYDFLEVPDNELNPNQEFSKRHTIAGNKTRFSQLDTIREDLGWKRNLSSKDLTIINQIAGSLIRSLGYQQDEAK